MTNRRKIEILESSIKLLKKWQTWGQYCGICKTLYELSDIEDAEMSRYLYCKRPDLFSKFYWNIYYRGYSPYWWPLDENGFKQRIKFLEHLIKKLKNEQ